MLQLKCDDGNKVDMKIEERINIQQGEKEEKHLHIAVCLICFGDTNSADVVTEYGMIRFAKVLYTYPYTQTLARICFSPFIMP